MDCEGGRAEQYYNLVATPVVSTCAVVPTRCLVAACVVWGDAEWWRAVQTMGAIMDPTNKENWRHDRSGIHFNWEAVFARIYGTEWKRVVASVTWRQQRGSCRHAACKLLDERPLEDRFPTRAILSTSTGIPKQP
eukprot:5265676-Pyramimonas_sp.AAC.1